jgi:hypothetical protein
LNPPESGGGLQDVYYAVEDLAAKLAQSQTNAMRWCGRRIAWVRTRTQCVEEIYEERTAST